MTTVVLNTTTRKVEVFSSARDVQARNDIAAHKAAADPHSQYDFTTNTKVALQAAILPDSVDALRLLGYSALGDGGGAQYVRAASEPAHPHKIQSADGTWWEELFAADVTVNIPSDFPTLQDAINRLSRQPVRQGASIILNIETGHALTAGFTVENGDYSKFTITSDDAEVTLDAGWTAGAHVAKGTNCRMPNWGILVNCGTKDTGARAITVENNSDLFILDGCGLKNAGGAGLATGLFVHKGSRVVGSQAVFSGCGGCNVHLTHASVAWLERGDFTGGEVTNGQGHGNVFVSRGSVLYAAGADFSDSVNGAGLKVRRSIAVIIPFGGVSTIFDNNAAIGITAEEGSKVIAGDRGADNVVFSNSAGHGVEATNGSFIDVLGATFTTITFDGVRALSGSTVIVSEATMTGIGRDGVVCTDAIVQAETLSATAVGANALEAGNGGVINAPDAVCTGALGTAAVSARFGGKVVAPGIDVSSAAAFGLWATDGGQIIAPNSIGTGCGSFGLRADKGGGIIAPGSDYSGATSGGAWASEGSRMTLTTSNVQVGVSADPADLAVSRGSIVGFWNGTGGTNTTVNTLSANGIIFQ